MKYTKFLLEENAVRWPKHRLRGCILKRKWHVILIFLGQNTFKWLTHTNMVMGIRTPNGGKLLDKLSYYEILKKDSASYTYFSKIWFYDTFLNFLDRFWFFLSCISIYLIAGLLWITNLKWSGFALMQGPGILFERLKETITIIKHHNRSPRYELRTSKFEE